MMVTTSRTPHTPDAETLSGVIKIIHFHRDGFVIARLDNGFAVKGPMLSPQVGASYSFIGKFETHPKFGKQFAFREYSSKLPTSPEAIQAYLDHTCKWIGPAVAKAIVERYGEETLVVLKDDPDEVAANVSLITKARAREISAALKANENNENAEINLRDALRGLQISKSVFSRILSRYGSDAAAVVKNEPYRLANEIDGVSFIVADKIARRNGIPVDSKERIDAGIRHLLEVAAYGEGHTFLPRSELVGEARELLGLPRDTINEFLSGVRAPGRLIPTDADAQNWIVSTKKRVALSGLAWAEQSIAQRLLALDRDVLDPSVPPNLSGLTGDQIEAVQLAMRHGVFVLHGAPGTGKTTTIKRIAEACPAPTVALCAPSGKAARRMSEATGMPAWTIHALLGAKPKTGGGFRFEINESIPLQKSLVIVDEVSMCDVQTFDALLRALAPGTRLVLVGDQNQLPSVGPGSVLKDIINSGEIAVKELTEIKRQKPGLIIRNCSRIQANQDVTFETENDGERDMVMFEAGSVREAQATIVSQVLMYAKAFSEPLRSIQVLTALREKTDLSVAALNERLRDALNGPNRPDDGRNHPFWVADKVMQTKNDYQLGVMNGDIGFVERVLSSEGKLVVAFEDPPRQVKIPIYDNKLQLAYACTVHKYQGSQAPIVIVVVHPALGPLVQTRPWFYTAISRAQKVCIVVGSRSEIGKTIRRNRTAGRWTKLKELLRSMGTLAYVADDPDGVVLGEYDESVEGNEEETYEIES